MSRIPWQDGFFSPLADALARHVKVALGCVRKCLVVDLDNTLWHGVLGEDGPLGVRVGIGDPEGESHLELQRRILALKQRGIILAVCSKNNPEDVSEFFRLRSDLPLRLDDFSALEIGWKPKNEALARIASDLNIGTDSLVFLDDSPAEVALIRQVMPEVECVQVPATSALRAGCLESVHGLDRSLLTSEDKVKSSQYADDAARRASKAASPTCALTCSACRRPY
jgi:FkbH-like protein